MARYEVIPHLLRVVIDKGMFGSRYIKFIFGPGAGCCWKVKGYQISGYTFYIAWKCYRAGMRVPKLAIGFTSDANVIPYTTH